MAEKTSSCEKRLAVVLPSLNPDDKILNVISGLIESEFEHIVIVDDGSGPEHQSFFEVASRYHQCTVLHHGINKGKGRALKTAFSYILENMPEAEGVITIDGDGQHLTKDIIVCGNRMLECGNKVILGCRDFDLPGVPPRSVAGNKSTSRMFRLLFGIKLSDTQTGLRAIPAEFLKEFCLISGERFEYETNMLLQMQRSGIGFAEQSIDTVYDPDDYSSHYNAFKDSAKIAKVMLSYLLSGYGFKYLISSVFAFIIDYIIYYFLFPVIGPAKEFATHLFSTFLSSIVNFNTNKYWVFKKTGDYWKEFIEYYCVCIPRTAVSTLCASLIISKLSVISPGFAVLVRLIIDGILFVGTYFIQKKWIFKKN